MITVTIDPIILQIGHFALRWYGLIVATAIFIGVSVGAREARRRGFSEDDVYAAAGWLVIGGLIGARLFHVLDHWSHGFSDDPIRALYIWQGGMAIWGGVVGGVIGAILFVWRRWRGAMWRRLAHLLDAAAPGLVLAQAVGRTACIITGDAMGKPTSGPFGFAYTNPNAMVPELGAFYTPMPVYEIIGNLAIFAVIWRLRKKDWPAGLLFLVYLTLYSLMRFFLAFTSAYRVFAIGLTQSQMIALAILALVAPLGLWLRRQPARGSLAR